MDYAKEYDRMVELSNALQATMEAQDMVLQGLQQKFEALQKSVVAACSNYVVVADKKHNKEEENVLWYNVKYRGPTVAGLNEEVVASLEERNGKFTLYMDIFDGCEVADGEYDSKEEALLQIGKYLVEDQYGDDESRMSEEDEDDDEMWKDSHD